MRARTKIEIMWPEPIDLGHVYRSRVQQNTKIQCIIMSITCRREPIILLDSRVKVSTLATSTAGQQVVDCSLEVNIVLMRLIRQCFG